MLKKIIAAFLIPAFFLQVDGCYSEYLIAKKSLNTEPHDIRVVTNDKREYLGTKRCWLIKNDTLVIYDNEQLKPQYEIPFNLIDSIYIDKIDGIKTAALTVSVISIVGALVYLAITNIKINLPMFNKQTFL